MHPNTSSQAHRDFRADRCLRCGALLFLSLDTLSVAADWHGELSVLSNYVYRGYSKSRNNPVVQGHLDYQDASGWFAGIGVSPVSFDDRSDRQHANVEFKPYVGWNLPLAADWRTDLFVVGYLYDDKIFAHDADYAELYVALHYRDWLSGSVSFAPDAYQRQTNVFNYELNFRHDIVDNVRFSAGLGFYQAKALLENNYLYWNLGVSWFLTSYLSVDVRYVDVSPDNRRSARVEHDEFYPRLQENKYLLSVTWGF